MSQMDWVVWLLVMLNNIAIITIFGISNVMMNRFEKMERDLANFRRNVGV